MSNTVTAYNMSFSTGGLFLNQSLIIADCFVREADWTKARKLVIDGNLLQTRTLSSAKRQCQEIIARLKLLSKSEFDYLLKATSPEQGYLLWIACCRRHAFVRGFAVEVIRERMLSLRSDLELVEFDVFFNRQAQGHPELDVISDSTRRKLRQILYRIMREAGIIDSQSCIIPVVLTSDFKRMIANASPDDLLVLPIVELDMKGTR